MSFEHDEIPDCKHCAKRFTNVFCKAEYDSMDEVSAEKECTLYRKGEYIFREGMRPYGIYCVNRGK